MKPTCGYLGKLNQGLVKRTVIALHCERVAPTLRKIKDPINDSIEINRSILAIGLNDLGFHNVKEGKT